CCECYNLRCLDLTITSTNTSEYLTDIILLLPHALTDLTFCARFPIANIVFPASLQKLNIYLTRPLSSIQLQLLSASELQEVTIRSTIEVDDVWKIFHALPLSVRYIRYTNMLTETGTLDVEALK